MFKTIIGGVGLLIVGVSAISIGSDMPRQRANSYVQGHVELAKISDPDMSVSDEIELRIALYDKAIALNAKPTKGAA